MKAADIIAAIEEFAPPVIQEKWDNTGLQIGNPSQDVHGVLIGFDCTASLVHDALESGCDMIITHHPLLFGALHSIDPMDATGAAVWEAVKAGIAVYSAHTSADKVLSGVSGAMAARLGLGNIRVLDEETPGVGLGAVGDLPFALSCSEAITLVKKSFSLEHVRCSKPLDIPVSRIAMCGGSGSSLIPAAVRSGAQLYLCGDISYHHFFTSPGFMLADIGHFESEVEIVEVLYTLLKKKFPTFAIRTCAEISRYNPIFYL